MKLELDQIKNKSFLPEESINSKDEKSFIESLVKHKSIFLIYC